MFLVPALILTALFTFYPMIMSWVFSTMRWSGFTEDMTFIGLDNYIELVNDPMFWRAFGRSAIFMLVGTPIRVILALLVAIVLNQKVMRLSPLFRTMFFLPVTAAAAVIGVVMTFVLSPNNGPLNSVLVGSGLTQQPVEFLSDPGMSLWTVLLVHVWKNFGITMIYWLAALQTIPQDYIEAARIDGAGAWGILRHIRLADPAAVRLDHHHPDREGQPARVRHRLDDDRRRAVLLHPADRDLHLPDGVPAGDGFGAAARVRLGRRLLLRGGHADLHRGPAVGRPQGGRDPVGSARGR